MLDLRPTTSRVAALVDGVDEGHLDGPTPMGPDVTGLVHHMLGLCVAFRDAAAKVDGPTTGTAPRPVTGPLPEDWRDTLRTRLAELADAWSDPAAWEGMTRAGGVDLPGEVCGLVALDEVLLHGWDLAVATGQGYEPDVDEARAVLPVVTPDEDPARAAAEREGVFGPPVEVAPDAPAFEQVIGLSGRDPAWAPAGA